MAMLDEAMPLIKSLGLAEIPKFFGKLPMRAFQKGTVTIMVNGVDPSYGVDNVATQPAAVAAQVGITMFNPDMLISVGTAGGFISRDSEIGDVYLCTQHQFHDRRIPIPGFDEYGKGNFKSNLPTDLVKKINLPVAGCSTGNSLNHADIDLQIIESMGSFPIVKEMEAAAIAQVAGWYEVPFFSIKSVTDLIDGGVPPQDEFQSNLKLAASNLAKEVTRILPILVG